jgi:hypothetical protein
MKTARTLLFGALALLSLSVSARAQAGPPAPAPPAPTDYGWLEGSVYTNSFLGLTLTLPEGWQPQGEVARKELRGAGQRLIGPHDPAEMAKLEKNAKRVFNLLTVTRYPLGAAVPFNPVFLCFAERLPAAAAGATDADFMEGLKKSLRSTEARVTIDRDVYSETVGGETFSVIDVTSEFRGSTAHQRFYAHVRRGYALTFVLSHPTPELLPALTDVIKSVRLR